MDTLQQKKQIGSFKGQLKYGITERKKAELDLLIIEVLDAQQEVDEHQAIVASLIQKLNTFQGLLATAEGTRAKAFNNQNIMNQLVQSTMDLYKNADLSFNNMVLADVQTKKLAAQIKKLVDKLIYSVELINKLSAIVISKKALNPLISDELVTMVGRAGGDANNAVSLTLIALQSTFASQAANIESESAASLGFIQSRDLFTTMTGVDPDSYVVGTVQDPQSLAGMISAAYTFAEKDYKNLKDACYEVNAQLSQANINLNNAKVTLKSLQSGLVAGNAAALVS